MYRRKSPPLEETFRAFTRCDAKFFTSLKTHANVWKTIAPLKSSNNIAWISVGDRENSDGKSVPLRNAPKIVGLRLLSYFDETEDRGSLGYYLYWGFIIEGSTDKVARLISPLVENNSLLKKVNSTYARSEEKFESHWKAIKPEPDSPPGNHRLERVFLIEPDIVQRSNTHVYCTLQGAVDSALLAELRPDIPPSEHPTRKPEITIDDAPLSEDLLSSLDSPLLTPKFKSMHYFKKSNTNPSMALTVNLESRNGLLRKTEIYSKYLWIESLTNADLVGVKFQVKWRSDGEIFITKKVDFVVPQSWSPGQVFSARTFNAKFPENNAEKLSEIFFTCQIGDRFPAKQVFASIPGDAIRLKCSGGKYQDTYAFIEDLGLAILMDTSQGPTHYIITTLKVVR